MDARARLRAYLEQRREMGETEFVLDTLHVDDVLRVLGAPPGAKGAHAVPPSEDRRVAPPVPERRERPGAPDVADWRQAPWAVDAAPRVEPPPVRSPASPAGTTAPASLPPSASGAPVPKRSVESASITRLEDLAPGLRVGPTGDLLTGGPSWPSLDAIADAVASCTRCPLGATAKNPVPGDGNPHADFVCVGEAPGANEDEQGKPFVGQAGQLLTKILAAINLTRDDVFICNVLKHRPPGNRNPAPDEVTACSPYLVRQIELLRPKVILALGTFAAQTLLQTKEPIGKLRGRLHRYHGVPVIVTYHPAALLRNPSWKRPTWEDVQLARKLLDRTTDV